MLVLDVKCPGAALLPPGADIGPRVESVGQAEPFCLDRRATAARGPSRRYSGPDLLRCPIASDARAGSAMPTWPQRTMPLETQMPWRETIRLILLAVLIAALGTTAIKIVVEQLS
jgi:hypothetical protein